MKRTPFYGLIPVFLFVFLVSYAPLSQATPISGSDISPDLTTIDFEDLIPSGSSIIVDSQYAGKGVTFDGAEINAFYSDMFDMRLLYAYGDSQEPAVITGTFSVDVNIIGLDFFTTKSLPLTLIAYDSDQNEIEKITSDLGVTSGFLGLHTDRNIAFFKLHDHGNNFYADNVSFGLVSAAAISVPSVPEPGALLLLGTGLVGIGILGRKIRL